MTTRDPVDGPENTQKPPPSLRVALALLLIGTAIGLLLTVAWPWPSPPEKELRKTAWYVVWSFTATLNCTLWLILGYSGMRILLYEILRRAPLQRSVEAGHDRGVRDEAGQQGKPGRRSPATGDTVRRPLAPLIFSYLALGAVLTPVTMYSIPGARLEYFDSRLAAFTLLGILCAAPAAIGLWLIMFVARDSSFDSPRAARVETRKFQFLEYVRYFDLTQDLLILVAVPVATSVAQTNAWRRAVISSGLKESSDAPPELVLVYGALFALGVAMFYLPPALTLRRIGRAMREAATEEFDRSPSMNKAVSAGERWIAIEEHRGLLNKALQLDIGVSGRLRLSLGLLAPVLVSMVGLVMPLT